MLSQRRIHAALRRHPVATDLLLAVLVGVVSVGAAIGGEPGSSSALEPLDALGVGLLAAASAALFWHRRAPLAVFAANLVLLGAYLAGGYTEAYTGYSMFAAVLAVSIQRSLRTALVTGGLCVAMIFILREPHFGFVLLNVVQLSAITFAVVFGAYLRTRHEYLEAARERERLAANQRELDRERELVAERARVARELHDVVAHSMSVVALQVGGARLLMTRDAGRADEALGRAEAATRSAMSELRRLLDLLRPGIDEPGREPPQPAIADIPEMLEGARAAGMPIDERIEGEPRVLSPGLELTAFRIVQEAITNALRHAGPGAQASVTLSYGADELDVEVSNTVSALSTPSAAAGAASGGRGLVGMRERVAAFGGDLSAGHVPDGGYRVRARLPTGSLPPEPPVAA